jgi:hypothetical protein
MAVYEVFADVAFGFHVEANSKKEAEEKLRAAIKDEDFTSEFDNTDAVKWHYAPSICQVFAGDEVKQEETPPQAAE